MAVAKSGSLQEAVGLWVKQLDVHQTDKALSLHLREEIEEVEEELSNAQYYLLTGKPRTLELAEECADVLIMLMHIANKHGFDLIDMGWKKHVVNTVRKWSPPDENGVIHHIKEQNDDDTRGSVRPTDTHATGASGSSHQASRMEHQGGNDPGDEHHEHHEDAPPRFTTLRAAVAFFTRRIAQKGYHVTVEEKGYIDPTSPVRTAQELYVITYSALPPDAHIGVSRVYMTEERARALLPSRWLEYMLDAKDDRKLFNY